MKPKPNPRKYGDEQSRGKRAAVINGVLVTEYTKCIPGHVKCPRCHHDTLPPIRGMMTGRMCANCKAIVNREGQIEL